MKFTKKKFLQSAGWVVGSAEQFLGLSNEETQAVEAWLAFGERVKRATQTKSAKGPDRRRKT